MEILASQYIDDELSLDEKVQFVDQIHADPPFYRTTRELLFQEKTLRALPDTSKLANQVPRGAVIRNRFRQILKPVTMVVAGAAAMGLLLISPMNRPAPVQQANRFIIYLPSAHRVELAGSFTNWQRTPLKPVGKSGYWELRLRLPSGEHRFAYILDGVRQMADPTLPIRERDDFGGENSILKVEASV